MRSLGKALKCFWSGRRMGGSLAGLHRTPGAAGGRGPGQDSWEGVYPICFCSGTSLANRLALSVKPVAHPGLAAASPPIPITSPVNLSFVCVKSHISSFLPWPPPFLPTPRCSHPGLLRAFLLLSGCSSRRPCISKHCPPASCPLPASLLFVWILYSCFPFPLLPSEGFPVGSDGKESACKPGGPGSIPGLGRSPGEGNGNSRVFLPGESHGQRSLAGSSPWGRKESYTTE